MADPTMVEQAKASRLLTAEAVARYLDDRVTVVADTMTARPLPPTDTVTSMAYLEWERRCLIEHGRAMGSMEALMAFGLASRAQYEAAKERLLWAVSLRVAQAGLGL